VTGRFYVHSRWVRVVRLRWSRLASIFRDGSSPAWRAPSRIGAPSLGRLQPWKTRLLSTGAFGLDSCTQNDCRRMNGKDVVVIGRVLISGGIARRGYRVLVEREASAWDRPAATNTAEFRRKVHSSRWIPWAGE
jgi:hypothetical protein